LPGDRDYIAPQMQRVAPSGGARALGLTAFGRGGSHMPASVIVAASAVFVIVCFNLLSVLGGLLTGEVPPVAVVGTVVGVLVLIGFLRRDRMAWQWGRLVSLLGLLFYALMFPLMLTELDEAPFFFLVLTVLVGTGIVLRLALFISLGRRSAKEHFRLRCPECGNGWGKAADFWFNQARCRACGHVW
jgi:hypothetical protein